MSIRDTAERRNSDLRAINSWRNPEGFGRPVEVSPDVFSVAGPDDLEHAVPCDFIVERGILPCSCDATRKRYSWWWKCWFRWQEVRVMNQARPSYRIKWPVHGPDHEPWVPGVDYDDTQDAEGWPAKPALLADAPGRGRRRAAV